MGDLHGVHNLLHPQPVMEVALVARYLAEHLAGEVRGQVGVVQRAPGFSRAAARRVVAFWHRHLSELDVIGPGDLQGLADPELLDQPGDGGALGAVDAHLDARVVAHRDEAALHRADRAVGELANEDIAVVDVHPRHGPGTGEHALGDEVPEHADDGGQIRVHESVTYVMPRTPVSLEPGDLELPVPARPLAPALP